MDLKVCGLERLDNEQKGTLAYRELDLGIQGRQLRTARLMEVTVNRYMLVPSIRNHSCHLLLWQPQKIKTEKTKTTKIHTHPFTHLLITHNTPQHTESEERDMRGGVGGVDRQGVLPGPTFR